MKKILILAGFVLFTGLSVLRAQVTLNCESGNRAIEQGNCWAFGATSYTNSSSLVITGSWSARSNQLTNPAPTACWIKTPWMLIGNGNITFKAKFEGTAGTTRGIELYYIAYDPGNAPYYEGTPVLFHTYSWPTPWPTTTPQDFSIPIPSSVANSTSAYKIRVSFVGTGGTARIISDDFIFPGTYWSDPANGCVPLVLIQDADGDGVADADDDYPNDIHRAYNNYFPGETNSGTLAFEDLWPSKGDYDFNDVVVNYRINKVTNAANNVVELLCRFVLRASGASYHNGFGIQLDWIEPDKIISVTGNSVSPPSIFNLASNGLEAGQTYANCIVFDDFYKVMSWPGLGSGINTSHSAPVVPYDTLNVVIKFIDNGTPAAGGPVTSNDLDPYQYNFYIVANQERGKEIHLADYRPTDLVDESLFGTMDDDSDIPGDNPRMVTVKYYKTANNLPWGINIVQGFDYPVEKAPINEAYLHFIDWASSSGINYPDWFENKAGYRDNSKIY